MDWAFSKDLPFGVWNVRDGWVKRNPMDDPDAKPNKDGCIDPYMALKLILDVDGSGKSKWPRGVFVMHAVHHWFKHPGVVECLRHYARDLAEEKHLRLVLVLPESVILPDDLKHDIPLLDYDLPDREELAEIFDYVIESSTPAGEEIPELFSKELKEIVVGSSGGMTQMEAEVAFSKGIVLQRPSWPAIGFGDYNDVVLKAKTEIVKNSEVLEMMDVLPMEDVGGLEIYKEWITECAPCFSNEALSFGVDAPKGVMLIGPPGCIGGNAEVIYLRGKRNSGRTISVEALYHKFNRIQYKTKCWDEDLPTLIYSFDKESGEMKRVKIRRVFKVGVRSVLRLAVQRDADDGDGPSTFELLTTQNHRFMNAEQQFVRADGLVPGDRLLMCGSMKPQSNGGKNTTEADPENRARS